MKILASWTRIVLTGAFFAAIAVGVGITQQQKTGTSQNPTPPSATDPFGQNQSSKPKLDQPDSPFGPTAEKQAEMRNEDRQKRLVADTDRLLQLATELHNDVGKTDQHILSIDVVKRADEIEKLAHNVKERMKG